MSRVYITTEKLYNQHPFRKHSCFCDYTPQAFYIDASQLVSAMESAADDGPDQYYVLRDEIVNSN